MASEYLSTKQIADKLNLPKQKVYRCIKLNHIKEAHTETVKGNTVLMYDKQAIEQIESILQGGASTSSEAHSEVHHEAVNEALNEAVLKQLDILNEQLKAKDKQIENLQATNNELVKQKNEMEKQHHDEKMELLENLKLAQMLQANAEKKVLQLEESKQEPVDPMQEPIEPDEPPTPPKGFWAKIFKK